MNRYLKQSASTALFSLIAFTASLNAAEDAQMREFEKRLTAVEERTSSTEINPPARPVVKDGVDIFITGEVLVWRAREDNLDYAIQLDQIPLPSAPIHGTSEHFKGKWNAGFRLGIGYNTPHDGWDLDLSWARFHSNNKHDRTDCICPEIFEPIFFPKDVNLDDIDTTVTDNPYVTEARGKHWRINLNILDLELGREFYVSKWVTVRPHAGLRSAWVHQKFRIEYEGGNFLSPIISTFGTPYETDYLSMRNNFWGMGLRGGVDTVWGVGAGVSVYAKLALSALWGRFKVTHNHTLETTAGNIVTQDTFYDRFQVCRPVADLALGLSYDTTFNEDNWGFGIWAGWEQHYFWGQNKLIKFGGDHFASMDQLNGDLSFAGFNAGMSFDF